MGSHRRRRTRILTVRLTDAQDDYIRALVGTARVTRADVARYILFGEPLPTRPQCSVRHGTNCTTHHADLVTEYRFERNRQEQLREAGTGGYAGDTALLTENGLPPLLTFADWLRQHDNHDGEP